MLKFSGLVLNFEVQGEIWVEGWSVPKKVRHRLLLGLCRCVKFAENGPNVATQTKFQTAPLGGTETLPSMIFAFSFGVHAVFLAFAWFVSLITLVGCGRFWSCRNLRARAYTYA